MNVPAFFDSLHVAKLGSYEFSVWSIYDMVLYCGTFS